MDAGIGACFAKGSSAWLCKHWPNPQEATKVMAPTSLPHRPNSHPHPSSLYYPITLHSAVRRAVNTTDTQY